MNNFVRTSDSETADKLLKEGFTLVDKSNGYWTFINNKNITFEDKSKVHYSNQLHV